MTTVSGLVKPGFEKVQEIYRKNIESGVDKASNFAAYYQGELVVDLWGGLRSSQTGDLWGEDTLSCVYSATKACTAFVIAQLVERGLLDYNEKISKYWPEFAQKGKENITLKQLISHSAGLPTTEEPFNITELTDDYEGLSKKLAAQEPFWTPGEGFGYHAVTFALYLDNLIRRVDPQGRSLDAYFREEFARPLGVEMYIGLPRELIGRATEIEVYDGNPAEVEKVMEDVNKYGDKAVSQRVFAALNPKDMIEVSNMNKPEIRSQPCGSSHGNCAARGLARIYSALVTGEVVNGKPLLSPESLQLLNTPLFAGFDKCFGMSIMMSYGTILWNVVEDGDFEHPLRLFGHGGHGGQVGFGDLKYKVGLCYTCRHLMNTLTGDMADPRSDPLISALYEAIYRKENINKPRLEVRRYQTFEEKQKEYLAKKGK